ncbi:MAG TPA: hypothetical protein PLQ54_02555, partial [Armatimonadota bacterium]|nr:hypothetical protein [Armatimonadota bacterium]
VKAIATHADLPAIGDKMSDGGEGAVNLRHMSSNILAFGKVLYWGHAIAAVAATTQTIADQAIALIKVEYEVLPPVLDLKTGTMPTGSLQLKTYDLGMKRNYGISADWGMFWTPGGGEDGGKLSQAVDLKAWSDDRVEEMYASAMRGIKAGVFLPHVTAMCRGCTVRDFCWAVAGERAEELPAIPVVIDRASGEISAPSADAQV